MSRDAKQFAVVAGIGVVGVVLGLTVSVGFFVLVAAPVVVLIEYAWRNSGRGTRGRPADPSRALFRDLLGDYRAKHSKGQPRGDG
jgi:hypothetical protein